MCGVRNDFKIAVAVLDDSLKIVAPVDNHTQQFAKLLANASVTAGPISAIELHLFVMKLLQEENKKDNCHYVHFHIEGGKEE